MAALIDLDRMKARLAELDAEREPLLALIRAAEAYEGVVGRTLFAGTNITIRQRSKPEGSGRAAPIMAATEAAVADALEQLGPLGTSDLALLLIGKPELNLPTKNSINVLSARLSNSGKFRSQRGVGWWFKDRPWPNESRPSEFDELLNEQAKESPTQVQMDADELC